MPLRVTGYDENSAHNRAFSQNGGSAFSEGSAVTGYLWIIGGDTLLDDTRINAYAVF